MKDHPTQPLVADRHGVTRFKANKIVCFLLELTEKHGLADMITIAQGEFSDDDRCQFAQLIGYSLSGYSELSYVDAKHWRKASRKEGPE